MFYFLSLFAHTLYNNNDNISNDSVTSSLVALLMRIQNPLLFAEKNKSVCREKRKHVFDKRKITYFTYNGIADHLDLNISGRTGRNSKITLVRPIRPVRILTSVLGDVNVAQ